MFRDASLIDGSNKEQQDEVVQKHSIAECEDDYYNYCIPNCNKKSSALKRGLCYQACNVKFGICLASAEETLKGVMTFSALALALVLATADGPAPIGDAVAVALLISLGILPNENEEKNAKGNIH